jgi:RNA polymerase primary sigma factor
MKTFLAFVQEFERDPTNEELGELLDMTPKEVANMLRGTVRHVSVDAPITSDDSDSTMLDVISMNDESPDQDLMDQSLKDEVQQGLSILSPREVEVLSAYYGLNGFKALTLEEIGELFNLTRERVRQIKERAIRRLRKSYNRNALRSYLG